MSRILRTITSQELSEQQPDMYPWSFLKFWKSGEWQVVNERLRDLDNKGVLWNPGRKNLFRALSLTPFKDVRCVICGQDPYPNPDHATGLAFSVPAEVKVLPPSLGNILKELQTDTGYSALSGDLTTWAKNGVLLWNAIPSCTAWQSMSHNWPEWELLTKEIFEVLSRKHVVFCFFGAKALSYSKYIDEQSCEIISTSHPSPRAVYRAKVPFFGSRPFSTINDRLEQTGWDPINWKLT